MCLTLIYDTCSISRILCIKSTHILQPRTRNGCLSHLRVCMKVRPHAHTYTHTYIHTHAHTHMNSRAYTQHTHTQTHTHKHTNTHKHTHITQREWQQVWQQQWPKTTNPTTKQRYRDIQTLMKLLLHYRTTGPQCYCDVPVYTCEFVRVCVCSSSSQGQRILRRNRGDVCPETLCNRSLQPR
jgi:hypothetical protein